MIRRILALGSCLALFAGWTRADPLSRRTDIDFFRDVPSRNLKGLAARSDGRLVAGPTLTELAGAAPADLLWCLAPTPDPTKWLVGTGPDGKILEITLDAAKGSFTAREIAKLDESHVFALARLPDGSLLAGTSSGRALSLIREGKVVARAGLPVDSVLDLLLLGPDKALVSTGNPGRIYRVDLAKFARAPANAERTSDARMLAERGITLFGEVRDRNLRRIARLSDGRIVAGSSPRGNIYAFPAQGGAPLLLQENRDAEVTDLLPAADGGFYAALTFASGTGETRITPPKGAHDTAEIIAANPPAPTDRFSGRSSLVWFPAKGFPETLATRTGSAFYQLGQYGNTIVITGGEQGEMIGYDVAERLSLTFAGSVSSQLNGLEPIPGAPGRFLVLRNNAPGFALLDFAATGPREAETRRIDLTAPALIGGFRFNLVREVDEPSLAVDAKASNGSDEVEGWSDWRPLTLAQGGWSAADLRGRYVRLRVKVPATAAHAELDRAALFALPQNRRPQLQEFHVLSQNYGLVVAPDSPASAVTTVGQILQLKDDEPKRKNSFLGSQVVPQPGAQVVLWTAVDPDGDTLLCTFSVRREGDSAWTDIAVDTRDPYAQFDVGHLPEGVYHTRLVVTETAPRQTADRLSSIFNTDDIVVDHSPPEILDASAKVEGDRLIVTVHGRDALSLVEGIDATFNNGYHDETEQPVDGIRDSREETFALAIPLSRVSGATAVEVTLYDAIGNAATKRLTW